MSPPFPRFIPKNRKTVEERERDREIFPGYFVLWLILLNHHVLNLIYEIPSPNHNEKENTANELMMMLIKNEEQWERKYEIMIISYDEERSRSGEREGRD